MELAKRARIDGANMVTLILCTATCCCDKVKQIDL